MKILLSWLREFVDVPGSPAEIAATMSTRGFAVEGIEPLEDGDAVIDFEVTANRPDCLSVIGMAREVATAYGLQVRRPAIRGRRSGAEPPPRGARGETAAPGADETGGGTDGPPAPAASAAAADRVPLQLLSLKTVDEVEVTVTIEAPELCPRYAAAVADVTVADSPVWMQGRLRACGIRPISNIVDVTNYVLLELGQPMHAFDRARLGGDAIRVRAARDGETIRTLDGQQRALADGMLVIADAGRPVAIAGVMGGADSEVSAATARIVLESAYFNPRSVRRTSRALGLKTEASTRYERGADPRLPITAMERACALIEAIGAGRVQGTVADRQPLRSEPRVVRLRRARIAALLGLEVADSDVRRILESLGFALRDAADGWDVMVPTRRVDVLREVDLLEDVARHVGFERIPATFPPLTAAAPVVDPRTSQARLLRSLLTGIGFSEAVTFGFIATAAAVPFADEGDLVPIANPLSETFAVLRPSLLPGLLDAVAYNARRQAADVRLFEIGACFSRRRGERRSLGCAWMGSATAESWSGPARPADFFDIKGVVERVCDAHRVQVDAARTEAAWLVAGRAAVLSSDGTPIATVGQVDAALLERYDLAGEAVFVADIDLDALDAVAPRTPLRVTPLPRYPSSTRDISVLVEEGLPAASVRATIARAGGALLTRVREFDRYQGKGIPEGKVSLSLRLVFRSPDRTLTDAEVQSAMDDVVRALQEEHGAVRR